MSQTLDQLVVKRLTFIRFLYLQGLEQVRCPQPLAATALLSFHDAVEMFLLLAAEHLGVNLTTNVSFDGYWNQISENAGVQLPGRPAMRRMNKSRVNLKHHGSIPSAVDLEQFRGDVTTFLTDATQKVFAADFHSLDMIDLVTQQRALALLRTADAQAGQGDHTEALASLSEAFEDLLSDYANRKRAPDGSSPYIMWPPDDMVHFGSEQRVYSMLSWEGRYFVGGLQQMQRAIRVLAMGLDYRRYARFELLVPFVDRFDGGRDRFVAPAPGLQVGDQEYQFCKQFVIETALHLAEIDFDLDLFTMWWEDHLEPPWRGSDTEEA